MKFLLPLFICFTSCLQAHCQWKDLGPKEWAKKLQDPADSENETSRALRDALVGKLLVGPNKENLDHKGGFEIVQKLLPLIEAAGDKNNLYFIARLKCIKACLLAVENSVYPSSPPHKEKVKELMAEAIRVAYETNDEWLIAYIGQVYFSNMKFYDETALAVMYGLYSTELYEKNAGTSRFPSYEFLAELMYRVREYDKCIEYCKKWLDLGKLPRSVEFETMKMFTLNTLALAYHRQAKYDSALYYYNKALDAEKDAHRNDWVGIISGNMGQVYYLLHQYDTAKALLEKDYAISMSYKYYDNAANSLQWASRANAALGNKEKGLQQVTEALELIKRTPDPGYQQNIYYAAMEAYRLNGRLDSSLYYFNLYQKLHDTIEKKINLSSIDISKVRLDEEKNIYNIRRLQLEKKAQMQQRNFIIIGILLLSFISILLINRQRLKFKHRQESLEQQNKMIEQEIAAAKKQMAMFTHSIIEKTTAIEKLEQQMQEDQLSSGQQEAISVLSHLTILTEDDWEKFKGLFEKIYPMFFQKLKNKSPDISLAEQRMAALTRLQLTARQMASMQGISPDSVHKTRQRLRQRLGLSNETNLEEYFSGI